jgi:RNA polymerase sigma-70 factor (ECF subfamily)
LYEEKPQEVVAAQMGLSENAFRQLLFRARSSFKKSLIGEAETAGLSMSQILSIAARKAAAESGKYISAAGAFLLVLAISIGVLPNLSPTVTEQTVSQPEPTAAALAPETLPEEPVAPEVEAPVVEAEPETTPAVIAATVSVNQASAPQVEPRLDTRAIYLSTMQPLMSAKTLNQLSGTEVSGVENFSSGEIAVRNSAGLKAIVNYDLDTERGIQSVWFEFKLGDVLFYAVPRTWLAEKQIDSQGRTVLFLGATDLVVGNADGKLGNLVVENSVLGNGKIRLQITLDSNQSPVTSSLTIRSNY